MATSVNRPALAINTYVRPGTYLGQLYRPRPLNLGSFPRIVTYIGKGVPYILAENIEIVRAFIYREKLAFSISAPFIATLANSANGSQQPSGPAKVRLYNGKDEEVPVRYWKFTKSSPSGPYDQVQLFSIDYNPNDTYYLDYQSTDLTVADVLPISGLRQLKTIGDRRYEDLYKENVDFQMVTTIEDPVADLANTGTGTVAINSGALYTAWNRIYTLTVEGTQVIVVPTLGSVSPGGGNTGTGVVAISNTTVYTGGAPLTYTLTVANKATVGGVTTLDLNWGDGTNTGTVACTSASPTGIVLTAGIKLDLTGMNLMVNADIFTFSATAVNVTNVQFSWYSDDYQSSSGLIDLYSNATLTAIIVESGILLDFASLSGFVVGDKWTIQATNEDSINWDFTRTDSQDFSPTDIYYDARGAVTGIARSYYFTLPHIPVGAVTTIVVDTGAPVSVTPVVGTPYVRLAIKPTSNIRATYSYRNCPDIGHSYYTTLTYTRPLSMYNVPLVYEKWEDYRASIGYPSTDNDLAVMGDYAFNTALNPLVACIQVLDGDNDGVYNTADYAVGLEAGRKRKDLTDICVLGKFEVLSDVIYNSQVCNDPLEQALRLYWIGYPADYPLGSVEEPNTIAYTSDTVLQVQGANPAHGTFISCANRWVTRQFITQTNSTVQNTFDGSFFAGMLAAINCAFTDMNSLLVDQIIPGIVDIDTFDDMEVKILGASSNLYALKLQVGSAKVIDAYTTDSNADDYHEINAMVVKQYVTKRVIQACNKSLIKFVPRNVDEGITYIRGVLRRELVALISEGIISTYTTADGRPRDINVDDIDVWRSDSDKTRYNITYWYNLRYGIKRIAGLYSVDENAFRSTGA